MKKYHRVLTIAGSDSGGGAGIQADLKTFSALGCYGSSAITAVTVQNTLGVTGIHSVPIDIVTGQIEAVLSDIGADTVKIGMLHNIDIIRAVAKTLRKFLPFPIILDPVMVATSGDKLIEDNTIEILKTELFPLAEVITPNLDEAEILSGYSIRDMETMKKAASDLLSTGCHSVLVKGGHLAGDQVQDIFLESGKSAKIWLDPKIDTNNSHGTGCTLSSAIAAYRAKGLELEEAVDQARIYIRKALESGRNFKLGTGSGPLNHFFNPLIIN
jgi:hydroxymethylpyrimidine/phosphomethylpyrimidine kinase